MSRLIIVTGGPGTGKSRFAADIIQEFPKLTAFSYDSVKEEFWDRYGFENAEEKRAIDGQSLKEFYRRLEALLASGTDVLIEYPFCRKHADALRGIIERCGASALTVHMHGEWQAVYARAVQRDQCDTRHTGHLVNQYRKDVTPRPISGSNCQLSFEEFVLSCTEKDYDIRIGADIQLDVTSFDPEKIQAAMECVRRFMESGDTTTE